MNQILKKIHTHTSYILTIMQHIYFIKEYLKEALQALQWIISLSIHPLTDTQVSRFLVIVNNPAMNIVVHIPFLVNVLFWFLHRNTQKWNCLITQQLFFLVFLGNLCNIFHSGFTNLLTGHKVSLLSTSLPTTFISCLFGKSYLTFISLMISDTEQLFVYLLVICMSSLEKYLNRSSAYFCLENPRDSGAWWAAVYGVAQSRTRLKRLSSSSKGHMVC